MCSSDLAVIMTAVAALAGIAATIAGAEYSMVSNIAFGMFLGPQVSFGPACCAAAYAWKRGYLEDSHDVFTPLISVNHPDILVVGGLFAILGWYMNQGIASIAGGGIDTVAVTVTLISLIAKVIFGGSPIGTVEGGKSRFGVDSPCWLTWQTSATGYHMILVGSMVGIIAGYLVVTMSDMAAETGNEAIAAMSHLPVWAIAVICFLVMATGRNIPVFHHVGLCAAYAAQMAYAAGGAWSSILWAAAFGLLGCYMGDWTAKLFDVNGPGYVDPPSAAIAVLSLFPLTVLPAIGANAPSSPLYYAIPAAILVLLAIYGVMCQAKADARETAGVE